MRNETQHTLISGMLGIVTIHPTGHRTCRLLPVLLLLMSLSPALPADDLRVAVAANFKPALDELIKTYEQKTGHRVLVSSASSGVLFNQIAHGAPFDVFLSADHERPEALEQRGLIVPGSRNPYAYGRLVLWHQPRAADNSDRQTMKLDDLGRWQGRLAMANPATAPYGLAAQKTLEKLGLWKDYQGRVVQGASIQQAWQFVASNNVELGLVAWSQVLDQSPDSYSFVPEQFHDPIVQELVILRNSRNPGLSEEFVRFLLSEDSQKQIAEQGYIKALPAA